MVNDLRQLIIKDFIPYDIPIDVKSVDILYKKTNDSNVYVAETIHKHKSPEWELFTPNDDSTEVQTGELSIHTGMVRFNLGEEQLLRIWDNVPRYALSQEIVANRLIYGNYVQGYNIDQPVSLITSVESSSHTVAFTGDKSLKSLRDYEVGMVFGDKYGRETPVITGGYTTGSSTTTSDTDDSSNTSIFGGVYVDKALSPRVNKLVVAQDWNSITSDMNDSTPPSWLTDGGYVKYYIKEPSAEYYNVVLDRWYDSGDNNTVWLSFNSADRNKIDEETHLILKNRHMTDAPVLEKARYKVLAIEDDAPDYIKSQYLLLGEIRGIHAGNTTGVWVDNAGVEFETQTGSFENPPLGWYNPNSFDMSFLIFGPPWNNSSVGSWSSSDQVDVPVFGRQIDINSSIEFQIIGRQIDYTDGGWGSVTAEIESEWRRLTHWNSTSQGVKFTWSKPFGDTSDGGANMYGIFNSNPALTVGTSSDDIQLEYSIKFRETIRENRPEFQGKFFVKIEIDTALSTHVLDLSVGAGANWSPIAEYKLSYIDSQHTNPSDMDMANDITGTPVPAAAEFSEFSSLSNNMVQWWGGNFDFNEVPGLDQSGLYNPDPWEHRQFFNTPWYISAPNSAGSSDTIGFGEENIYLIEQYYDYTSTPQEDNPSTWGNTLNNGPTWYMPFVPLEALPDEFQYGTQQPDLDEVYLDASDSMWGVSGFVELTEQNDLLPLKTGLQFRPGAGTIADPNLNGAGVFGGTCGPRGWSHFNLMTKNYWDDYGNGLMYGLADENNGQVFMDGAGARRYVTTVENDGWPGETIANDGTGSTVYEYDFYKPTALEEGKVANADGSFGTLNSLGRMNLGVLYSNYNNNNDGAIKDFFDIMTSEGTVFRFTNDLSGDYYKITWVEPVAYSDNATMPGGFGSRFTANYHKEGLESFQWNGAQEGYGAVQQNGGGIQNPGLPGETIIDNPDMVALAGTYTNSYYEVGPNGGHGCKPVETNAIGEGSTYQEYNNTVFTGFRLNRAIEFRRIDPITGILDYQVGLRTASGNPSGGGVFDPRSYLRHDGGNFIGVQILKLGFGFKHGFESSVAASNKGAIFETEPKPNAELDIYYEGSNALPLILNKENSLNFAPIDSKINIERKSRDRYIRYFFNNFEVHTGLHHAITSKEQNYQNTNGMIVSFMKNTIPVGQVDPVSTLFKEQIIVGDDVIFIHKDGTETRSRILNFMEPIDHEDDYIADVTVVESVNGITENPKSFKKAGQSEMQIYVNTLNTNNISFDLTIGGTPNFAPPLLVEDIIVNNILGGGPDIVDQPIGVSLSSDLKLFSFGGTFVADTGSQHTVVSISNTDIINAPAEEFVQAVQDLYTNAGVESSYTGGGLIANDIDFKIKFTAPTGYYEIDTEVWKYPVKLSWHNCYSFINGLESDRIRDDFNAPQLDNGNRVSASVVGYGEENISSGMIYSGIYNSTSQLNALNEFNMAFKATKELNPIYGSIQALKTRDTDVVVLTEDKALKVLANKDAVYNADGNPQLTSTNRVLGQVIPFAGDYGISKNPESLAWDQYRMYFTDKQRGAVLRLSMDGLTPISSVGMKTWFRENLRKADYNVGSFDIVNEEYNITLTGSSSETTVSFSESSKGWTSFKSFIPTSGLSISGKYLTTNSYKIYKHDIPEYNEDETCDYDECVDRNTFYGQTYDSSLTVLFNERPGIVKSFKTISYEGSQAKIEQFTGQNNVTYASDFLANGDGSVNDNEFYNLVSKNGWWVETMETDLEKAQVNEFINKENKWFNKVSGIDYNINNIDTSSSTIQGLGILNTYSMLDANGEEINVSGTTDFSVENPTSGCTDSTALNYNADANIDDGGCVYYACTDNRRIGVDILEDDPNYNIESQDLAGSVYNTYLSSSYNENYPEALCEDDASTFSMDNIDYLTGFPVTPSCCDYYACTDPNAINYVGDAIAAFVNNCDSEAQAIISANITSTGSGSPCQECYYDCSGQGNIIGATCGCNDSGYLEYWTSTPDETYTSGYVIYPEATTMVEGFNTPYHYNDNSSCVTQIVFGCMDEAAYNYNPLANINSGGFDEDGVYDSSDPCVPVVFGCMDAGAVNYNPLANTIDENNPCITPGAQATLTVENNPDD